MGGGGAWGEEVEVVGPGGVVGEVEELRARGREVSLEIRRGGAREKASP